MKGRGEREKLFFVHLINTIGKNKIVNYDNLLEHFIEIGKIYKITKISSVDKHHFVSPTYYFYRFLKDFREDNLLEAFLKIYHEIRKYYEYYRISNKKYQWIIDKIIYRAFSERGNKLSIPQQFKNFNVKDLTDLIVELEVFLDSFSNTLKRFDYEVIDFGVNTDLKIKQLHLLSLNYISNLHIHIGILVNIYADYFKEKDIFTLREFLTLFFHLIHLISVIRFNFYIHSGILKKRKNLDKFREFVDPFVKMDEEGFIYPILLATTYTIDEKVRIKDKKLNFYTPINKRIHWKWLLPYDITGNIDVITKDKKLKELLIEKGFRWSRTYDNEFSIKNKKIVPCLRKNIRKKIVIFNKEKLEKLIKNNKKTSQNTYVKWKSRKVILNIVKNSRNIEEVILQFNKLIEYYLKYTNIYGITMIAKVVKMYNYMVLYENINDWQTIKRRILRYMKPKPKAKKNRQGQKSIHERSSSSSS